MSATDVDILARWRTSHRAFIELLASGSATAALLEPADGVLAMRAPIRPERSLVNSVVYADAGALQRALPVLAGWYDEAGIRAWTVWTHVGDEAAAQTCRRAGHALDATPELMWAPIEDTGPDRPMPAGVELDEAPGWRT